MDPYRLAHSRVAQAVKSGHLPSVRTQPCADCGGTAAVYHHDQGYDEAHALCVVPLCGGCHKFRHAYDIPVFRQVGKPSGPSLGGKSVVRNRVRQFRILYGYSQRQVAEMAGVSEFTVVKLENIEGYNVSMANAERLCKVFSRMPLERLFWIDYTAEPQSSELEAVG